MTCKWSINLLTNSNPSIVTHTTRDNMNNAFCLLLYVHLLRSVQKEKNKSDIHDTKHNLINIVFCLSQLTVSYNFC
jgi:hypothetical protein